MRVVRSDGSTAAMAVAGTMRPRTMSIPKTGKYPGETTM
jgi:hypothetical protein